MVINGRCRGNGAQLAHYLLNSKENDRAEFLIMYGAASSDPRRALLEMSLTSEISGKTSHGLYHMQLSPRIEEAAQMTWEQKIRAIEITAEQMGLEGHRWWLAEHEKDGRIHLHPVFERYNHDTGIMWKDDRNYEKHMAASRQMEKEFGWQLTHEDKNHLDKGIKAHITDFWLESENGADFVKTMNKAGFEVTQGMDRRPYQIVDQYGTVHDLSRQLKGIKQADVSKYLNSIRDELRPTAEASHDRRSTYEREKPEIEQAQQSDNSQELSDSQDLAAAMIKHVKQDVSTEKEEGISDKETSKSYSYSFKFEQPPSLPREPEQKILSDKTRELSDSQVISLAMLKQRQATQQERLRKEQEAQQQAKAQTTPANDNDPLAKFRVNKDNDKLSQFRGKNDPTRSNERTRERGIDE